MYIHSCGHCCGYVRALHRSEQTAPLRSQFTSTCATVWEISMVVTGCRFCFALLHLSCPHPTLVLILHYLLTISMFTSLQEEESPENGELRRAESSPTPLKRDRSFSEHDLALLRGEMLPSFTESAQLDGAVRLRGERPRSRTLSGARPPPNYRGWYLDIVFSVSLCIEKCKSIVKCDPRKIASLQTPSDQQK